MEQFKQTTSSKKRFKLNDVAEQLQVKKFVIRVWEKEFNIEPQAGSYSIREIEFLRKIKQMVVDENCSLEQAKNTLLAAREQEGRSVMGHEDTVSVQNCAREEVIAASVAADAVACGEPIMDTGSDLIDAGELPEVVHFQAASREVTDVHMQNFLTELAFFKQELQKFQSLLEKV